MPFRGYRRTRRSFRGRRRRTRRSFRGRRHMGYRRTRHVAPTEQKFRDINAAFGLASNNAGVFNLSLVAQGDTQSQRIGMQTTLTSLLIRLTCLPATNSFLGTMRVLIYVDKMPDQQAPQIADLLQVAGVPMTSPVNLVNALRYQILRDKLVSWSLSTKGILLLKFYVPLHLKQRYLTGDATIDSIASNNLVLMFLSDADPGDALGLTFFSRVRYVG